MKQITLTVLVDATVADEVGVLHEVTTFMKALIDTHDIGGYALDVRDTPPVDAT